MQDVRHATEGDTAANVEMMGGVAAPTEEAQAEARAPTEHTKTEPLPSQVVVDPSSTLATMEAPASLEPPIPGSKVQASAVPPTVSVPEGEVSVAAPVTPGSTEPLQVDAPVHHTGTNGTAGISPKDTSDKSQPEAQPRPESHQDPAEGSPTQGARAKQPMVPPEDAPVRPPSHQNPRPSPHHNPLPRPPIHQVPQMRHPPPHQGPPMGRPLLHGPPLGPPVHPIPPMIPSPRQFSRMGHRPSYQGPVVVLPHHQAPPVPQQLPQRPMVSPPGLPRYQGAPPLLPPHQDPGEGGGSPHYHQEGATGEDPGYKEEDPQYQEGASYQAEGATPYQGQVRHTRRQPATLRISKWVNPIPPDPDDGQQQVGEQELATKMLQIQSKRFYIDVKQNRRGRFMKVAEIGADGRRNQVFLALSTAAEFRDHLSLFSDFYANLGPPNPDTLPEDGKLKSETMVKDNRRYYLDLKENSRGRFLRVSQTIARGGPRCQIAIPAQGMIEFRDALQELLDEFGTDDGGYKGELPEGRHMRVENKNFYFDIGQNNRGIYMRISEVKTNFRTAITIPEKSWSRFRDIFADYVDKMKDGGEKGPSESNK